MKTYMNEDRTLAVILDDDGSVSVATREQPSDMWGPPETLVDVEKQTKKRLEREAFRARVEQARIGY